MNDTVSYRVPVIHCAGWAEIELCLLRMELLNEPNNHEYLQMACRHRVSIRHPLLC
jgi:hypothetical protein